MSGVMNNNVITVGGRRNEIGQREDGGMGGGTEKVEESEGEKEGMYAKKGESMLILTQIC